VEQRTETVDHDVGDHAEQTGDQDGGALFVTSDQFRREHQADARNDDREHQQLNQVRSERNDVVC
jgi:hypothetical protein